MGENLDKILFEKYQTRRREIWSQDEIWSPFEITPRNIINTRNITVPLPERYIINENATILFWENGEKTVVKRCADDEFNPRLAFLTAFFQHYCGMSKNKANKYLANLLVEIKEEKPKHKPKHIKEENKKYVTVVDDGASYTTYPDWIEKNFPKYIEKYKVGEVPTEKKVYEVIGKAEHEEESTIIYLIQDTKTKQVYMIGEYGIKEEK